MAREEILAAPLTLYVAPVGESFPDLDQAPGGDWELLGKSGDKNYTDDGVAVSLSQTTETFTPVGATLPVKAWRTEEGIEFTVTIADVRAELLAHAMNNNDTTESDGVVSLSLVRGLDVTEYALLARGKSPYDADGAGQFQVPRCFMSSDGIELVHRKGEPVAVELTFTALEPDGDEDIELLLDGAGV